MVIGSYSVSVDNKGRFFVPAKWRDTYGDVQLIAMRGITENPNDHFLLIMPLPYYSRLRGEIDAQSPANIRLGDAARSVSQYAFECDMDSKGRILIDKRLLDYAGFGSLATLADTRSNCFEVWEPASLDAKNESYTLLDSARDLQRLADERESAQK